MIRRRRFALGLGAAVLAGLALTSEPAGAFVRYRTAVGQPFSWRTKTVKITGYPSGIPTMTVDQITAAMTAAVGAWSREDPANGSCSYLDLALSMAPETAVPPNAIRDYQNVIAIRDGNWESICSTTTDGRTECHQPGELALTTVWSWGCGQIVDADVEVNAERNASGVAVFVWTDVVTTGATGDHDLQNALTHEMGHFIGLDHTCVLPGAYQLDKNMQKIIPIDNLGNAVPDCNDATPEERAATMFPSADAGDTDKRSLTADDLLGLCTIYPVDTTPVECAPKQMGGCSVVELEASHDSAPPSGDAPGGRWRWWLLGLSSGAGILTVAWRRRSSRRR
jgi:hypothetical protein